MRTYPIRRNGDPGRAGTKARGSFSGTPTRADAERAAKAKGYLSKAKIDAFIEAFLAGARAQAKAGPASKTLRSPVYGASRSRSGGGLKSAPKSTRFSSGGVSPSYVDGHRMGFDYAMGEGPAGTRAEATRIAYSQLAEYDKSFLPANTREWVDGFVIGMDASSPDPEGFTANRRR